jgi:hypothetical protein
MVECPSGCPRPCGRSHSHRSRERGRRPWVCPDSADPKLDSTHGMPLCASAWMTWGVQARSGNRTGACVRFRRKSTANEWSAGSSAASFEALGFVGSSSLSDRLLSRRRAQSVYSGVASQPKAILRRTPLAVNGCQPWRMVFGVPRFVGSLEGITPERYASGVETSASAGATVRRS